MSSPLAGTEQPTLDPPSRPRRLVEVYTELGHTLLAVARSASGTGRAGQVESQLTAAVDAFRKAVQETPGIGLLRGYLADALAAADRRVEAVAEYVEAVRLDPEAAQAVLPAAASLLDPEVAEQLAKPLRMLAEQSWVSGCTAPSLAVHRFLGHVAALVGDGDAAETHWRRVVECDADDLGAVEQLARALNGLRRPAESVALLEPIAAAMSPDAPEAGRLRLVLGQALAAVGRPDAAESALADAVRLDGPHRPAALLALAQAQQEQGRIAEALDTARWADAATSDVGAPDLAGPDLGVRIRIALLQAQLLLTLGAADEADAAAARALTAAPTDHDAVAMRVRTLIASGGDVEHAVRLARGNLRLRPRDVAGHRLLVDALQAAQRPAREIAAALATLIELAPEPERRYLRLEHANAALAANDLDAVEAVLRSVDVEPDAAQEPGWAAVSRELARRRARSVAESLDGDGDPHRRVAAWRAVVTANPGDAEAQLRYGEALFAAGDLAAAEEAAEAARATTFDDDVLVAALLLLERLAQVQGRSDDDRAELLYLASRQRYWQTDRLGEARELLERAVAMRHDHAPSHWYLAEYALLTSSDADNAVNEEAVGRGLAHWETAERLQPEPGEEWGWVFLVLVGLLNQQARLPGTSVARVLWRGVLALERWHLLGTDDVRCPVGLASLLRPLGYAQTAMRTLDGLSRDDATVAEQAVLAAFDLGQHDLIHPLLDSPAREQDPWEWRWAVRALLHVRDRDYAAAVPLLRRCAEKYPTEVWFLALLGDALWRAGEHDEAADAFGQVWEQRGPALEPEQLRAVAMCGYRLATAASPPRLDQLAEAIALLHAVYPLLQEPARDRAELPAQLAVYAAAAGDADEARRRLDEAIPLFRTERDAVDLLDEVDVLRRAARSWPTVAQVGDILDQIAAAAHARGAEVADGRAAPDLAAALAVPTDEPWVRFGAAATSARLDVADGRWEDAARTYRRILAEGRAFCPEAARPLRTAARRARDEGDAAYRAGDTAEARRLWEQALDEVSTPGVAEGDDGPALHGRLALAVAELGAAADVTVHLAAAGSADRVADVAGDLVPDLRRYWALDDALQAAQSAQPDRALGESLAGLRRALSPVVDRILEHDPQPDDGDFLPMVSRVVLEIGSGLVADDTGVDVWPLFTHYIPAMRGGIEARFGVPVAGVRVRETPELAMLAYIIRLDENPVRRGELVAGRRWTPATSTELAAAGVDPVESTSAPNGHWIHEADVDAVRAADLAVEDDPLEFVIHRLGAVLRQHLAELLDLQDVVDLLTRWREEVVVAGLVQLVAPDDESLVRLGRLLRSLAADRVPLSDPAPVLEAARDAGLWSVSRHELVAAVRMRLRDRLPGNDVDRRRVRLTPEQEAELARAVHVGPGGPRLSLPPDRVHALVDELGVRGDRGVGPITVVTRSRDVRPLLQLLLDRDADDVAVLAVDELVTGDEETR